MIFDKDVFLTILSAVLTIVVTIVTSYVVPWLKTKITASQIEQINHYIEMAVRCAEQMYKPDEWAKKKEFVMDYICEVVNSKFSINLNEEDIDFLIEGVVNEVKKK